MQTILPEAQVKRHLDPLFDLAHKESIIMPRSLSEAQIQRFLLPALTVEDCLAITYTDLENSVDVYVESPKPKNGAPKLWQPWHLRQAVQVRMTDEYEAEKEDRRKDAFNDALARKIAQQRDANEREVRFGRFYSGLSTIDKKNIVKKWQRNAGTTKLPGTLKVLEWEFDDREKKANDKSNPTGSADHGS
jgi:hypothetical protein